MNRQLNILVDMISVETRMQRRNPIWIVSFSAAVLLGYSEAYTAGVLGWPTANHAVRAYQLACTMIFGVMAFLLVAGSLGRDLGGSRRDLILSRPVSVWVYVFGKYVGNVLFVLSIAVLFMGAFLVLPMFHGQEEIYPLRLFGYAFVFSVVPTVVFSAGLGVLLMSLTRKGIIAIPVYLVYFLAIAIFRVQSGLRASEPVVDMWDFSMRLYPNVLYTHVGASGLFDMSYSHLFNPMASGLYVRAVVYVGLSVLSAIVSVFMLKRFRSN